MTAETETATNLLNEHDAERLEKVGFEIVGDQVGIFNDDLDESWFFGKRGNKIDAALLGILEDMVWRKDWSICRHHIAPGFWSPIQVSRKEIDIWQNATPREIFEAFLDALEETDGDQNDN